MAVKQPWPFGHPTVPCAVCHGAGTHRDRLQAAWTSPTRQVGSSVADLACGACAGRGRVISAPGVDPETGQAAAHR